MGPAFTFFCEQAMGFRAVSDLSDYSIAELLSLIEHATRVLREKLSGTGRSSSPGASSSGISVIEPEAASSSTSIRRNSAGLKSPFTCGFHCKFCDSQCCRPEPHKNHACIEHRKWR